MTTTATATATAGRLRGPEQGPELLDVRAVATLLDCSARHVYRLADAGRMPQPVKLGALVRWRRKDLSDWIDAGCPRGCRKKPRDSGLPPSDVRRQIDCGLADTAKGGDA